MPNDPPSSTLAQHTPAERMTVAGLSIRAREPGDWPQFAVLMLLP